MPELARPAKNSIRPEARRFFNTLAWVQSDYAHMLGENEKGLKAQFNHYVRTQADGIQMVYMPCDFSTDEGRAAAYSFSDRFEEISKIVLDTMNEKLDVSIGIIQKEAEKLKKETGIDLLNETRFSLIQNPDRMTHANLLRLQNLKTRIAGLTDHRADAEETLCEALVPNYSRTYFI